MKRTQATSVVEQLEPRVVLADTYYAWISVESLPGFAPEYGEPAEIVGASDNGRYLWSWPAANRGGPDEPYIVVDGEVRYLRDMPDLADAELGGINSDGTVLARDVEGDDLGRTFLLDLAGGRRRYLDELHLQAPADFDLAAAEPDGDIAAYWWTPRTNWTSESITHRLGDAAPTIPGLVTYQTTRSGKQHIAGVNAEGDVMHIYWLPDGTNQWRVENLTELALG